MASISSEEEKKTKPRLQEELRQFFERTSLTGAPRIVKSSNKHLTIFWLVAVVFLLGMTTYATFNVLTEYFAYETVSQYQEVLEQPIVPAVTVCNYQPLRSDYADLLPPGVLTKTEFCASLSQDIMTTMNTDDVSKSVSADIFMYSYLVYLSEQMTSRGLGGVETFGQPWEDMIIHCNFMTVNERLHSDLPCDRVASFDWSITTQSLSCTRITLNDVMARSGLVVGLSLIVYLDRFSNDVPLYMFDHDLGQQSGIFLSTTFDDFPAQIYSTTSSFSPNQHATLNVGLGKRSTLPHPYSTCTEEGPKVYDLFGNQQPYAQEACVMACQQAHVERDCACMYHPLYFSFEQRSYTEFTLPFCHSYHLSRINVTVARVSCAQESLASVYNECEASCSANCSDQWFTHYSTSTKWPHVNYQAAFYRRYIKQSVLASTNSSNTTTAPPAPTTTPRGQSSYERRLSHFAPVYDPILLELEAGNTSRAQQMLRESSLIDDNFVKLTINFNTAHVQSVTAKPKMTASSFLSLLGGIFNLYAGISFVLVFELIEFCARLARHAWQKRREAHDNDDVIARNSIKRLTDALSNRNNRWVNA